MKTKQEEYAQNSEQINALTNELAVSDTSSNTNPHPHPHPHPHPDQVSDEL